MIIPLKRRDHPEYCYLLLSQKYILDNIVAPA